MPKKHKNSTLIIILTIILILMNSPLLTILFNAKELSLLDTFLYKIHYLFWVWAVILILSAYTIWQICGWDAESKILKFIFFSISIISMLLALIWLGLLMLGLFFSKIT